MFNEIRRDSLADDSANADADGITFGFLVVSSMG